MHELVELEIAWADGLGCPLMRKLKKMEQTTINIRIFIETEICVRGSEVMATGSETGSSADVALRWKKVM